ncbi:MAG: SDR family NAD(P)-dependent oxidoreductase [Gaiellaceae bacterium]
MANELDGKVALVTGASQGLGRQFAATLARAGATLVVASRNTQALEELAGEIAASGGTAHVVQLDVTDVESIETAVASAIEQAGAIDILINNAGLAVNALVRDTTPEDFDLVMNTNVRGAYFVAKHVGAHMQERGSGKIVNLSSVLSEYVMPGVSVYCMSKSAISQMTKAMALEFAGRNVQVNALAPGFVDTEINRAFFETSRGQDLMGRFPGGALQQPQDLDSTLLFLASSASDHLTGITLHIDDGQSLGALQAARKRETT